MVTAVIVDDEKKSREVLIQLINEVEIDINILGQADSVESGFEIISEERPQLVFLDIEMLDGTGFNLLEKFKDINFEVVFTTAYDHYAIQAFKYSAIDYLLKPINIDELRSAIDRAKKTIAKNISVNSQIDVLLSNIKSNGKSKRIAIKGADRLDFIEVEDIIYCMSGSSYTNIVLKNGRKVIATKPLKYFDAMLSVDFNFFRVSRVHLINPIYIRSYKKEKESVELESGIEIEISRRRKKEFLEILGL